MDGPDERRRLSQVKILRTTIATAAVFILILFGANRDAAAASQSMHAPTLSSMDQVSASSGPVEITLTIQHRRIPSDEPVRYRVRLKNIGNEKIPIFDGAFSAPEIMNDRYLHPHGELFIEVLDSKGKPPSPHLPRSKPNLDGIDPADDPEQVPLLAIERKRYATEVAGWKKQGISDGDIDLRLAKLWRARKEATTISPHPVVFWLEPEASTTTAALGEKITDSARPSELQGPESRFAEISALNMPPGHYQVRALWNMEMKPSDVKKYQLTAHPWNVRVKTPPIEVEVLP